jgi:putative copper export protein
MVAQIARSQDGGAQGLRRSVRLGVGLPAARPTTPPPTPGLGRGAARLGGLEVPVVGSGAVREKLTILNAFVHDVATGTWIGTLALLTLLHHETSRPAWILAAPLVPALERKFLVLTWISLGVIVATGFVRMLTWKVFGWTGDVERDRIRLLKVKHAVLGIVFAAGTAWMAGLVYL